MRCAQHNKFIGNFYVRALIGIVARPRAHIDRNTIKQLNLYVWEDDMERERQQEIVNMFPH